MAHFLHRILEPSNVAVFGASDRPGSPGQVVFANLREGGFKGSLVPINPRHEQVQGIAAVARLAEVKAPVDVAVIATPPGTVPGIVRQCMRHGVRGAIVLSDVFGGAGASGRTSESRLIKRVRAAGLRLIGPNCLGAMRPSAGFNAIFSNNRAGAGDLALVSQSGAICTALLDWAEAESIGFSTVLTMGDAVDVDLSDAIDYLALDHSTRGILLYVEAIGDARRLISALRAAARTKPVIVIKPGRHAQCSAAVRSHTGAMVGADDVFDAALERTGAVRVMTISQLFAAARILSGQHQVRGNRLAIITNAGGPAVMAADRAADLGVALAELGEDTVKALNAKLPARWSGRNPVDLLDDADAARFEYALSACLDDHAVDAAVVMATPQATTDAGAIAAACGEVATGGRKPVLGCWMGADQVEAARTHFNRSRQPHFRTPEAAVEAFAHLAAHHRNQRLLLQVPGPLTDREPANVEQARAIIEGALAGGYCELNTVEAKALLAAFRIPVTRTARAKRRVEAQALAETFGYPVVLKIDSPDIPSKSDVGGVQLGIESEEALSRAWDRMLEHARRLRPEARIDGMTVERMHSSNFGRELMIGVLRDPVFGPVISFGSGGTSVEVLRDRAVALPPLNEVIIEEMVARTRVSALLKNFRNMPPVDHEALERVLLRVSEMVCELPEIRAMDINPLIADERGLVAVDARVAIGEREAAAPYAHMAIHPYPSALVGRYRLNDGRELEVRPIRPEDAKIEQEFVRRLSDESRYYRFMQSLHELTPALLARFTQIDYDREMALIAVHQGDDGGETQVAVARYVTDPDGQSCEFALTVADEWQGQGLGTHLMNELMRIARSRGLQRIHGEVLSANVHMLGLMRRMGFRISNAPEEPDLKWVERGLAD